MSPQVWWRSSAPGVDLLAYFAPNPLHPLFGSLSFGWLSGLPAASTRTSRRSRGW